MVFPVGSVVASFLGGDPSLGESLKQLGESERRVAALRPADIGSMAWVLASGQQGHGGTSRDCFGRRLI